MKVGAPVDQACGPTGEIRDMHLHEANETAEDDIVAFGSFQLSRTQRTLSKGGITIGMAFLSYSEHSDFARWKPFGPARQIRSVAGIANWQSGCVRVSTGPRMDDRGRYMQ